MRWCVLVKGQIQSEESAAVACVNVNRNDTSPAVVEPLLFFIVNVTGNSLPLEALVYPATVLPVMLRSTLPVAAPIAVAPVAIDIANMLHDRAMAPTTDNIMFFRMRSPGVSVSAGQ